MQALKFESKQQAIGQWIRISFMEMLQLLISQMQVSNSNGNGDGFQSTQSSNDDPARSTDTSNGQSSSSDMLVIGMIHMLAAINGLNLYPGFVYQPNVTSPPMNVNCYDGDGVAYQGDTSHSMSGDVCLSWEVEVPCHWSMPCKSDKTPKICKETFFSDFFFFLYTLRSFGTDHKYNRTYAQLQHADYTQCNDVSLEILHSENRSEATVANGQLELTCPYQRFILSIEYAKLGNIVGSCQNSFSSGDFKNLECYIDVKTAIESHCLGKQRCAFNVSDIINVTILNKCIDSNQYDYVRLVIRSICDEIHSEVVFYSFLIPKKKKKKKKDNPDLELFINGTEVNETVKAIEETPSLLWRWNISKSQVMETLRRLKTGSYTMNEIRWSIVLAIVNENSNNNNIRNNGPAQWQDFRIRDVIDDSNGKWPLQLGGVVMLESQWLQNYVTSQIATNIRQTMQTVSAVDYFLTHANFSAIMTDPLQLIFLGIETTSWLKKDIVNNSEHYNYASDQLRNKFKVNDFSQMTVINHKKRLDIYKQSDYNEMKRSILEFGRSVMLRLSNRWYGDTVYAPLLIAMQMFVFIRLVLQSSLDTIAGVIVILSSVVIYSLLLSDVEVHTCELGVLRCLGMRKTTLLHLLSAKSLLFSVIGIVIGLPLANACYALVAWKIAQFANLDRSETDRLLLLDSHGVTIAVAFEKFSWVKGNNALTKKKKNYK
ncbi:hypothetical protein RFI_15418 [Reticulomyxa filosa]|uniref:ABC3 transporter permease C-terminal domain-containing protein n=1 Tax=Reticulomyxa filosa TaxID=46433 RepID=X6N673_RETFI|nr:hypothetical protein RFI_15418 [Reticulomyxa filosa]|eukprot:ETO21785.1 hypothetical protein RFI_15418 [Reticulomyxa filosa]